MGPRPMAGQGTVQDTEVEEACSTVRKSNLNP